jgi:Zinc dependent phospholipase C
MLTAAPAARAYSLLTHEQLIDLTWQRSIVPLLRSRYPNITEARAYAYGGCAIQDIGYYPFGDVFFSELTHYVRTGDFIANLFREARNANELAFAIGALSHYIGDTVGHSEATNLAVPEEFPKLEAMYGPVVTYAEDKHAHVQTEFAFDINEITHGRLAPFRYLQRVGLRVPVTQLAAAFYDTYGLGDPFSKTRKRRINVRGYRFAVRSFLPRIAYAVTILNRGHMPPDVQNAEFQKMAAEAARVASENDWQAYRRKPGVFTYSLAGIIYILPKVGPLKLVAIKGPTELTEEDYVRSVNRSTDALRSALARFGGPKPGLENRDLDTGSMAQPGAYKLTDETYAALLHRLAAEPHSPIPAGVKADVLGFYAHPNAPIYGKMYPDRWERIQADLLVLETIPVKERAAESASASSR